MNPIFKVLCNEIGDAEYRFSLKEATLVYDSQHMNLDEISIEYSKSNTVWD